MLKFSDSLRYHVLGNHCVQNLGRTIAMRELGMPRGYYDVAIADGWRFVMLDGTDMSLMKDSALVEEAQVRNLPLPSSSSSSLPHFFPLFSISSALFSFLSSYLLHLPSPFFHLPSPSLIDFHRYCRSTWTYTSTDFWSIGMVVLARLKSPGSRMYPIFAFSPLPTSHHHHNWFDSFW